MANTSVKIVQIRDLNERGQGVGAIVDDSPLQGKVCFVDGALPGETVSALVRLEKPRFLVLELLEVLAKSPDRILSDCEYFPECGSCQLRHMDYHAELSFKQKRVRDLLSRQGPLEVNDPAFLPIIGMEHPLHYRSKSIFPIQKEDDAIKIGQYRRGTHDLVDLFHCQLHGEVALDIVNAVRELILRDGVSIYDEQQHRGTLRHLVVREGFSSKQLMLIFVVNDKEADDVIRSWIPLLKRVVQKRGMALQSVWINDMDTKGNRILSSNYRLLEGEESITETINGVSYNISPDSFFQVNPIQAAVLFDQVVKMAALQPDEKVLDLYSGVGALALQLASAAQNDPSISITGVDLVPQAILDAKENAEINNLQNLHFIAEDATSWLNDYENDPDKKPFDVIVVDPPRKGLDPEAIDVMNRSGAKRIVYVSCNPSTLARDLSLLSDMYSVSRVQPVDMFPRTMHVETVVLMSRVEK